MKKIFFTRIVILFLLAVILLQSCAKSSDNTADDDNIDENNSAEGNDIEEQPIITDDLPDGLNFNGETFTILYRDYMNYETYAEAETGEVINDAVYRRNAYVEERLNIKFNMVPIQGAWDHKDSFLAKVRNTVSAGDDEYDMINGYAAYIVELSGGGYLLNWKDIPYIGFDKPWWNQDFTNEMTINNKQYYMTGDLALSTIHMANVLFFNKNMWQDYGFEESPYKLVKDGKWTLDKMAEFTKQVTEDVNGDGKYNEDDLYGYVTDTHNQIDAYVVSFDVPISAKGDDGLPKYQIQGEKFATAFMRLYEFTRENESTFAGTEQPTAVDIYCIYRPIFQNQRALILAEYLGNSSYMRDYDFDFGILPFPKLDENQPKYKTMPQNGYTMFCIPATVSNPEKVGAVMEALSSESYKSVVPAFYDIALKTKYARDEDSAEMIDIIRDGISYNFAMEYVVPLGSPHLQWRNLVTNKKTNITSEVERQMNSWEKNLEKILIAYE